MIRRVPVRDITRSNETYALEGNSTDLVPKDRTVYIDRNGTTYDPQQKQFTMGDLPDDGVVQLPRTTWW